MRTNAIVEEAELFKTFNLKSKAKNLDRKAARISLAKRLKTVHGLGTKTIATLLKISAEQVRRD